MGACLLANSPIYILDLRCQCEAISVETGCWLYIGAQHLTATAPFAHYASPRLRQEGLAELNAFHNQLSQTMVALVAARRQEAKSIALDLAATRADLLSANLKATRSEQALLAAQAEAAHKDEWIARLEAMVATISPSQ
jgi:hypothetical protein